MVVHRRAPDLGSPGDGRKGDRLEILGLQQLVERGEDLHARALTVLLEHRERTRVKILDRKSTRLNSSHVAISYAVFCLKKKSNRPSLVLVTVMNRCD